MSNILENIVEMKEKCLKKLSEALENLEKYAYTIKKLEYLALYPCNSHFEDHYHIFINNMSNVFNATEKYSLHLYEKTIDLNTTYAGILKMDKNEKSQNESREVELKTSTAKHWYPAEESKEIQQDDECTVYSTVILNEVYKKNDIITGIITSIANLEELSFYIFDNSSKYRGVITELSKMMGLRQYHGMPKAYEVFGCVLDNQIFRAVHASQMDSEDGIGEETIPCYILDTGEMLTLNSDHIMYKLTDDQKMIPAQAIGCQIKVNNPFLSKKIIAEQLRNLEYEKCQFKILEIEDNTLHVELIENARQSDNNLVTLVNELSIETAKNLKTIPEIDQNQSDKNQLTEEELDMLYEEPLNTNNVMKAVMGYDPQDDKRICRFYNPKTGGCFKGAHCKLEHTLRRSDGWTKDVLPTASRIDNYRVNHFAPNTIINITPTFVGQLDRIFAQINDTNKNMDPLIWTDEDIPFWKRLQKPPLLYDLVLSRYIDGHWYRGKIISHHDDYKVFKIFYVDYGNTQLVHLRNLAAIDISMTQHPFQAVLCRFENVSEKPHLSLDERKCFIENLSEIILNKSMDVKVISDSEDLFISFVDKETYPLPDILIEMGCLELKENVVI